MEDKHEKLLTPSTAAEIYGIKQQKIYYWIKNRRFSYIKPNKEILFWESEFLNFLSENTVDKFTDYDEV